MTTSTNLPTIDDTEISSHLVKLNDIRLHYVTAGEGELVILIHGFPEFWYCWREQIKFLSKNYKVVALDLRGHNLSDSPKDYHDYALEIQAKDIQSLISHLDYQNAYIIGHDIGGTIAYATAAYYPDLVKKLMVMSCPHPSVYEKAMEENKHQKKRVREAKYFFFPLFGMMSKMALSPFFNAVFKGKEGPINNKAAFTKEVLNEYKSAYKISGNAKGAVNQFKASIYKVSKPLPVINVPTKIIWGDKDPFIGTELLDNMDKLFTQAPTIEIFENCSHWTQIDYPDKVNESIVRFLEDN